MCNQEAASDSGAHPAKCYHPFASSYVSKFCCSRRIFSIVAFRVYYAWASARSLYLASSLFFLCLDMDINAFCSTSVATTVTAIAATTTSVIQELEGECVPLLLLLLFRT